MCLLVPAFAMAQSTLSGQVQDASTRQSLAGATIVLGSRYAQTDGQGHFRFSNLKEGSYTLQVSYVGYESYSTGVRLKGSQQLTISLQHSSVAADEVLVSATRATENSATTYKNLSRRDLEKTNQGRDLPYLLNQTPSLVVNSDAGAGVGYTGFRIRGSDATRVNVTLNGIPLNNSESQGSFFVNLPDFASSVDNIQIQRGVGTSTNGAGAFGGSLNIQTITRRDSAYAELNNSYGSFDTWKNTVNVGTGLINNKVTFDARMARIKSDGYIDKASSDLKSYFLSGAFYGKKDMVRVNVFSGKEKTFQAWGGVPESIIDTNRTYNYFTYDDQTDNYTQNHYQAFYTRTFSPQVSLSTGLHYTDGAGYYEEYENDQELSKYKIPPVVIGDSTIATTDLIRRRWLDNDFYGLTFALNYQPQSKLKTTLGGAWNKYDGDHFGEVIWARVASGSEIRHRYYQGNGLKTDFNIYGRADYTLDKLVLYADLQYRRLWYKISGTHKTQAELNIQDEFNFFNPKVGLTYHIDASSLAYASYSVANKEPNRDDYINSITGQDPKRENLQDIEAGYRYRNNRVNVGINGYWMLYHDQLILTGTITDVGEAIRQNVDKSYRLGVELDAGLQISSELSWRATAALSRNRIKSFTSYDYSSKTALGSFEKTIISFSPSFVGSSELAYQSFGGAEIALLSKYVSRQFMENSSNRAHQLKANFVNDVRLGYQTPLGPLRNMAINLTVNNIFDELYANNGYIYGENYYFPQATRNFLLSLSLKF